jgi:hypothetical protein
MSMRMRHWIVGAALGAILCSVVPTSAGADGAKDPKVSGLRERGTGVSGLDDPRFVTTRTGTAPNVTSQAGLESSLSDRETKQSKSGGPLQQTQQVQDLRKFAQVAVQRDRCHPRDNGEEDDDAFVTTVGLFGNGHSPHEPHAPHRPHEPPFCPSPH